MCFIMLICILDYFNIIELPENILEHELLSEIERLNKVDKVEYANVLKLKLRILELMYKNFQISIAIYGKI